MTKRENQPQWVRACSVDDIPVRAGRRLRINSVDIGVFRTGHGAILALVDRCPHKGGPLSEGLVHENFVVCPLHSWKIDLVTGGAVAPDRGCVTRFPVEVRDNDVYIDASVLPREVAPVEDITGVHPDTGRPKLGRKRAQQEDFTVMNFDGEVPVLAVEPPSPDDEQSLRLRVSDEQRTVAELSLDDLKNRYPVVDVPTHVTCLMFGFTRAVRWQGVRLVDVLNDFGPQPFASFYAWDTTENHEGDRFFETLPAAYARDPRTMLVFGMNGGPLPKLHGGPLRLVVPFLQGYKSVKWLTWIKLTGEDEVGYKKKHGFIEFPEFQPPAGWKPPRRPRKQA